MDEQWLGRVVDLNCGVLGVFQGVIDAVHLDEQTITIKNVIHDGIPSKMSSVTIEARDITNIDFIENTSKEGNQSRKQATSTITVPKKKTRPVAESLALNSSGTNYRKSQSPAVLLGGEHRTSPKKGHELFSGFATYRPQSSRQRQRRDEDCFDDLDLDNIHLKEFDFERNLALFDKQRVLEEIESNQPDVVRLIDHNRRGGSKTKGLSQTQQTSNVKSNSNQCNSNPQPAPPPPSSSHQPRGADGELKYRNDQNVLVSEPTQYRCITTEEEFFGEYQTDQGLMVPAVSYKLRERFMAAAEAKGISRDRLIELVARTGTELAIQLLGGSRRLNPSNSHQVPLCVVLCGPGRTGEYGMTMARHLSAQGIKVVTFLPHLDLYQRQMANELALYKLCCKSSNAKLIHDVKDLPVSTVDLIVMALDDHDLFEQERNQPWYRGASRWCRDLRSPVLAIDPLASPISSTVHYRACVVPGLPLWYTDVGKIHMVNLAIPSKVYKDVGINFQPPFGAKSFVILEPVS